MRANCTLDKWAGEGEAHLRSVSSGLLDGINIQSVGQKIHNKALRIVDDFVSSVRAAKGPKVASSSRAGEQERASDSASSDEDDDCSDSDAELQGVAAAEFRVAVQATPDKRRPPVPSFVASSPPAAGSDVVSTSARGRPQAPASSGGSKTSARDSSPGSDEDDCDENDPEQQPISRKDWEGWKLCSDYPRMPSNAYPHLTWGGCTTRHVLEMAFSGCRGIGRGCKPKAPQ